MGFDIPFSGNKAKVQLDHQVYFFSVLQILNYNNALDLSIKAGALTKSSGGMPLMPSWWSFISV